MQIRRPIVAGRFYPGDKASCVAEIDQCLRERKITEPLPDIVVGGIVPHAGWTFSGSLAALVFSAIKQCHEEVATFVICGAAHSYYGQAPAVYHQGGWSTPLGQTDIDEELAEKVINTGKALPDINAHGFEHSIEVQIPFVRHLFPQSKILPIVVPPTMEAVTLGEELGRIIDSEEKKIVCIGSTDLTHYGPGYGFTPVGSGPEALDWAEKQNDKLFIEAALKMKPQELLTDAAEHQHSCGPGAAAVVIAAAKQLGIKEGKLLAYTNSNKIMKEKMHTGSSDSVGYAAIIF